MAGEAPRVEQVQGGGDVTATPLPEGEATALNEATPAPSQLNPDTAPATPQRQVAPPEPATPSDYRAVYQPDNEADATLVGPSLRPNEPVTAGAFVAPHRPVSPQLRLALPLLYEASMMPDAPEQMKFVVKYLADRLS